mmetsp:Transcript_29777/g.70853  ORF Transcript_29777/g.70853 Transcript_29777/m.70853 type:complete len:342 (-) Transcript_29777:115-1140(-)
MESAPELIRLAGLHLLIHPLLQQQLTALLQGIIHALLLCAGRLEEAHLSAGVNLLHGVQELFLLCGQLIHLANISLVQDDQQRTVLEEGLDGVVEGHLRCQAEAAMLRDIHEKEHGRGQVSQSRDGRHLDAVPVLQGMVQNARSVDDLPLHVVVVQVSNEQRLGCEGILLHVHIRIGDNVHERGFPHVGIACQDQGPGGRIDGRQAPQVLPHLFEEGQSPLKLLHRGGHAPQGSTLQHLALVKAVCELHHLHILLGNAVHHLLAGIHLTQRQLVVVPVVQDIAKVCIEGVDVVDLGKLLQYLGELLAVTRLAELHLAHVEAPDAGDLETRMYHSRSLALSL